MIGARFEGREDNIENSTEASGVVQPMGELDRTARKRGVMLINVSQ